MALEAKVVRHPILKPLYEYEQTPMTPEQSEYFMKSIFMEKDGITLDDLGDFVEHPYYRVITARLAISGITLSPPLSLFIVTLCDRFGSCTLYAYALLCIARKDKVKHLTTDNVAYAFTHGFPSEKVMNQAWADQKTRNEYNSNGLDDTKVWEVQL